MFEQGQQDVRAVGEFVHVFVKREGGRPASEGMGDDLRKGLGKLLIKSQESKL